MYTFSIIIPHHNIPTLLQRCLESIPDNDYIQVIVIDDNSSSDIVDFSNFPGSNRKNVEVIFDKSGLGAGHARNLGLERARGTWLIFADADDFFVPDMYDIINQYKDSPEEYILFKADSVDSDTLESSDRHVSLNKSIDAVLTGTLSSKEASLQMPTPWCRMIKRDLVERKNILYDEVMASNDVMFITRATCFAKNVMVSDKVLYVVTTRLGSLWNNSSKSLQNYLCRLSVYIRRNRFYDLFPFPKTIIMAYVFEARKFGLSGMWEAFKLVCSEKALFSGFGEVWPIVKRKFRK